MRIRLQVGRFLVGLGLLTALAGTTAFGGDGGFGVVGVLMMIPVGIGITLLGTALIPRDEKAQRGRWGDQIGFALSVVAAIAVVAAWTPSLEGAPVMAVVYFGFVPLVVAGAFGWFFGRRVFRRQWRSGSSRQETQGPTGADSASRTEPPHKRGR